MDAIEQLKQDVREGRIGVDRLIDVIEMQQRQLQSALRRIEELEKKAGGAGTAKVGEPFSMRAEEKRQRARRKNKKLKLSKKGRRGRSEEHTSELQSHRDLHSFPTRRSSDLHGQGR